MSSDASPPAHADADWLVTWVEENWINKCLTWIPHHHFAGLCMFVPALMVCLLLVLIFAGLAECDKRSKAGKAKLEAGGAGPKTASASPTKQKKPKKVD